jgi:two-component system response regulator LytT
LKPNYNDDLEVAVQKFQTRIPKTESQKMNFEKIRKMLSNLFEKSYEKRFSVRIRQHLKVILVKKIECIYSEKKGAYIHIFDSRKYLVELILEILELELDPKEFYRISRKFIFPLKSIIIYSNSRLKLILPSYAIDDVVLSKEKVTDFKN